MENLTVEEITQAVGGKLLCGDPQTVISYISIDSRDIQENTLFTPIIGERVDAHKFISQVFEAGAKAAFTSRGEIVDRSKPHILVENTEAALGDLAVYYRSKFPVPVVGITGSVGKTSTKEMIAAALSSRYNVLKTAGNQNSNIGVPLTLFRLGPEHEIAVVEMGISDFGEMDALVRFAGPRTAVVTNIGVAHIGILKTQENIMNEKLKIAQNFQPGQPFYLNGNDPMLKIAASNYPENARLFGHAENGKQCDFTYYAKDMYIRDGMEHFTFVWPQGETQVVIRQLGVHNVNNAVVAMAIAMEYGIDPETAAGGLYGYEGVAMRQQINHLKDGIKVIDDTYNASPDSIKSGIEVLKLLDNPGRKIAVLADVLELGDMSRQCHYDTGCFVAQSGIDEVVTVGEEMKALVEAVREHAPHMLASNFSCNADAAEYLKKIVKPGDAFLVKGSRGMRQEEIVKALKEYLS
ncbi:UDP-N-acetylmuramoyl-tripeptide--D-alanyl-D-alanine ligase [Catenibacillus scindens]|uniref:UDP-N-acetylmuramoyl-tripeptide--D-alanyl-D-alanine ligase n=1 Tax=Catenibacillus scindens TaxID=673271 RepID=A0A7W8HAG4_9FIRM|nr:UDP-N-acetylmuramoyl-tripeptide--D-alanyl-D-alanine ligase [Catenibacillus scindens]MBB5264861.1 UDP-N-acetylmuramoyl-tripeptide--D-alanyl-D-alanine ligase [Catenibacillus scindens]